LKIKRAGEQVGNKVKVVDEGIKFVNTQTRDYFKVMEIRYITSFIMEVMRMDEKHNLISIVYDKCTYDLPNPLG